MLAYIGDLIAFRHQSCFESLLRRLLGMVPNSSLALRSQTSEADNGASGPDLSSSIHNLPVPKRLMER